MKKVIFSVFLLLIALWTVPVFGQTVQSITRIRDNDVPTSMADVLQLTLNMPTTTWGLVNKSGTYYYDGTNFRWWLGAQMNTDNVAATTAAPWVGNFNHAWDSVNDNWDRMTGMDISLSVKDFFAVFTYNANMFYVPDGWEDWVGAQMSDALPATPTAPYVLSLTSFYDGTNHRRWLGAEMSSDAVATTTVAPWVGNFNMVYQTDSTTWARQAGETADGGTLAATVDATYNFNLDYGWDGSTWSPTSIVTTQADGLAFTLNGKVVSAVMYGSNGATLDMMIFTANGGVQVGLEEWHPAFDAANAWVAGYKKDIAVVNPAVTAGIAVDETATNTICASTYMLNTPNWTVIVKNAGGGSGDAFTDVDVQVSYDETTWVSLTSPACDTLTTGTAGLCFDASNKAYPYIRVNALCGAGDDTTADCKISGNKN